MEQNGSQRSSLTTEDVNKIRAKSKGQMNIVDPPVNCPKWVCCLLPCIKNIPSMKVFKQIIPEDAEIERNNKWVCYDATSVVCGDIIRLREGDIVPADCMVLSLGSELVQDASCSEAAEEEMAVDVSRITGEARPRTIKGSELRSEGYKPVQLFYGGYVLHGCCVAVVNAIGKDTLLAKLISDGRWPPTQDLGIPLHATSDIDNLKVGDEELATSLLRA